MFAAIAAPARHVAAIRNRIGSPQLLMRKRTEEIIVIAGRSRLVVVWFLVWQLQNLRSRCRTISLPRSAHSWRQERQGAFPLSCNTPLELPFTMLPVGRRCWNTRWNKQADL